ncbi:MAG: MFS transporter [Rhodospirillaceae bacterium]|jgi:MFS transporter, DHA1 family, tetracycline resistance protein|nr:MFS transporter [Rhodospirillaceae bacterium]MBT4219280.1 MFS transporter [Rhodospirillaceae bacterium]MBT5013494.1 MFS transporter [Rhodospirillaceae bacterium]MBT5307788.1 MFS transporter [Rhodospirillaceae bacterium]MBT6407555.1 MFS transporter [Rhodospirillaceae bacterium]
MLTLFLIVFIDLVGFGLIIPLLPFYAEHFQASPMVVGFVMAVYSLAQFIAAPFWGRTSDRIGRRPVLLVTLAGGAVSYVMLGFADSLWLLIGARVLGGFMAGNISTAFAYVADITTPENRAKGMGTVGAAFGLGFIAGPAIGGILAGPDPLNADFLTPSLVAAGLSLTALIMAFMLLKESLPEDVRQKLADTPPKKRSEQFRAALAKPNVGLLIGLSFLATFVFAGMETTFAMWSERKFHWGPQQNGYLFAYVGLLVALIQGGLVGRLVRRFGEANLIVQGAVALAIGMLLIPFSDGLPMLLIAMAIVAYGFGIITPSMNSLISLQVGPGEQGGVMGVTRSATTMARVLGPAWAGTMFMVLGKDWPYFGGAIIMVVVVYLGIRAARSTARD